MSDKEGNLWCAFGLRCPAPDHTGTTFAAALYNYTVENLRDIKWPSKYYEGADSSVEYRTHVLDSILEFFEFRQLFPGKSDAVYHTLINNLLRAERKKQGAPPEAFAGHHSPAKSPCPHGAVKRKNRRRKRADLEDEAFGIGHKKAKLADGAYKCDSTVLGHHRISLIYPTSGGEQAVYGSYPAQHAPSHLLPTVCVQYNQLANVVRKSTRYAFVSSGPSQRSPRPGDGGQSKRVSPDPEADLNTAAVGCGREIFPNLLDEHPFTSPTPHSAEQQREMMAEFTEPGGAQNTSVYYPPASAYTVAAPGPTPAKQMASGATCLHCEDAKEEAPCNGDCPGATNVDGPFQYIADDSNAIYDALFDWHESSLFENRGGEYGQLFQDAAGNIGGSESSVLEGGYADPAGAVSQETHYCGGSAAEAWLETGLSGRYAAAFEATESAALRREQLSLLESSML